MTINTRLAAQVTRMLKEHGFDATLQQRVDNSSNDFEISQPTVTEIAVRAVWDNPRLGLKTVNDGAQASLSPRYMTIAYRDDIKSTSSAVGLRVLVNGIANDVLAVAQIGDKVGLRLYVQAGTEA